MQFKSAGIIAGIFLFVAGVLLAASSLVAQEEENVVVISAFHNTAQAVAGVDLPAHIPDTITVQVGDTVRIYNSSTDPLDFLEASPHDPVFISRDEEGADAIFEITVLDGPESSSETGFRVDNGAITVVEFVASEAGTFFISHRQHGHGIVGTLVVEE